MWQELADYTMLKALVTAVAVLCGIFSLTWALSRRLDNYSFVDITWAYGLAIVALLYAYLLQGYDLRRALMLVMAMVWSCRLGTYLLFRIHRHHPHEDVRYQVLRKKWQDHLASRFFWFFQAQGLLVLLLSIPVLLAMHNDSPHITLVEWIGAAVWLTGVSGEAVSDAQMAAFKKDPGSKGKVCNIGLWRLSRHPNYFFESVTWFGFWLFACGSPWGWATVYAPLLILFFLLRVTGIPLTEKCAVESKGDAYRDYQLTTSAFIPWFPKSSP